MPTKKFSLSDEKDTVKTNLVYDESDDKYHIENTQDIEEIIKAIK